VVELSVADVIYKRILKDFPDWQGGLFKGIPYPHHTHTRDFLFSILQELKARNYTREDIELSSAMRVIIDRCVPHPKNKLKKFNRSEKIEETKNIISLFLDDLYPSAEGLLTTPTQAPTFGSKENFEEKIINDTINFEIFDQNLSKEERYARYLKKLDKDSYEGRPIININARYGLKEMVKDYPEFAPPPKSKEGEE
jgi:hypothetical protein